MQHLATVETKRRQLASSNAKARYESQALAPAFATIDHFTHKPQAVTNAVVVDSRSQP
jgi:hypothetical protein